MFGTSFGGGGGLTILKSVAPDKVAAVIPKISQNNWLGN